MEEIWKDIVGYENACAIHSLPGLFDGLQDIVKEIGAKQPLTIRLKHDTIYIAYLGNTRR